jgi:hypothetical protein
MKRSTFSGGGEGMEVEVDDLFVIEDAMKTVVCCDV